MNEQNLPESLNIENYQTVRDEEAIRIAHSWLNAFCPTRTSFKGILRYKSYIWDMMDYQLQNEEAVEEYEKHEAPKYVLMEDCFGQDDKVLYIIDKKPKNIDLQDFHVYPKNMAWTMAFTHEDGWIGPKFSKHKSYEKLNRKNEKAIRALHENYTQQTNYE